MAHYVAELMDAARDAPPDQREAAEGRCASAILELWDHRAGLSGGRLLMDLGPVIEVLNRLDPTAAQPIYFRHAWRAMERDARRGEPLTPARAWLRTAELIDRAARMMIVFALGKAAETETDRAKPWVALAEGAGADGSPDIQLIRRMIVIAAHGRPDCDAVIEELEDRLARLAEFRQAADLVASEWREQLDAAKARDAASASTDHADYGSEPSNGEA